MKQLFVLLFLPLLLVACSAISGGLTDEDIKLFLAANKALDDAEPELDAIAAKEMKPWAIPSCGPCLDRMEQAVQEAGYKDLKTALVMELRIHLTVRAWLYASIGKLAGEAGKTAAAADLCSLKEEIARSTNPEEMALHCARLKNFSGYLDGAGALTVGAAEKLLKVGDIEVIDRHADELFATHDKPRKTKHDHYSRYD